MTAQEMCGSGAMINGLKDLSNRVDGAINPVSENIEVSKDRPIERVARGGSWFGEGDQCRVTYRASFAEDYKVSTLGFRIVRGA